MSIAGEEQVRVRFIHDFAAGDVSPIAAGSELLVTFNTDEAGSLAGVAVRLDNASSVSKPQLNTGMAPSFEGAILDEQPA